MFSITDAYTYRTARSSVFGASLLALAITLGAAGEASAQPICAPHADMAQHLDKRFSERPTAIGIASNGRLLEVYTSGDGATWTIVMTTPDGHSCVVADGQSWDSRQQIALGPQV